MNKKNNSINSALFYRISNNVIFKDQNIRINLMAINENEIKNNKYKVLLVEDNDAIRKLHCLFLKDFGFEVDAVITGEDALSLYKSKKFDLILLDIGLPGIDGIEVCKKIRALEINTHIPIIALTAHGKCLEEQCLQAGINRVLLKPILADELKENLLKFINSNNTSEPQK